MKLGIYGYGNIGRGVETALLQNKDIELVGMQFLHLDQYFHNHKFQVSYNSPFSRWNFAYISLSF